MGIFLFHLFPSGLGLKVAKSMDKNKIISQIEEIQRLKESKAEPYSSVKERFLRNEILKNLGKHWVKVGGYFILKAYQNSDIAKPYLQIYTKKTWKIHQNWLKIKLNKH